MIKVKRVAACPLCGSLALKKAFTYTQPPLGEVTFSFNKDINYYREYWQCQECDHFVANCDLNLSQLYESEYASSTYKDSKGLRNNFKRIISLEPKQSDNIGRVSRIHQFAKKYFKDLSGCSLLDVGSGLGVFPYAMKQLGWDCIALDPDYRVVEHLEKYVGVKAVKADFLTAVNLGKFDLITFNKVLEHVVDPIAMLKRSKQFLKPGGLIYIELPDAKMATIDGKGREEFFIEHLHVFSLLSTKILAQKAGFELADIECLQEPSTKYTLRAFLILPKGEA
ncbi:MAG: class I SAM-dependent methyltransferase [Candidatus Omnitrophota bacterium]